ncbi:hypothetical protein FRC14_003319 [Serendipita sp. 396]|nr:hypothetical protein FRC14_003319 [Serendipita sp. 396]KAG8783619.1 hypothetical protein FRC15_004839 [Serendipita sp. 397]KAG8800532.1 hypothetical protein FRC16_002648 [Serendipita sp. 398]KAG8824111.1 hypothetical protein FRC19_002521 [Serendipita sp. 401]KAG8868661.1 hypothetical protein FRC20_003026 [Serendipita sp. 405]KAG9055004.1 hypothetical protein FS842_003419 [Serendipita sp. 407]
MNSQKGEYQHTTVLDMADGFELYNTRCSVQDRNFIRGCNQSMDTLLVFAGLFSAIVTAFMIQNTQMLGDNTQRTNELLVIISMQLNSTFPTNAPLNGSSNQGPKGSETANIIFTCSLVITLMTSLAIILVKQWIHVFRMRAQVGDTSQEKARSRAKNWRGIELYQLEAFISSAPMLLHLGLALFFSGLLVWCYEGSSLRVFIITCILITIGCIVYVALGIIYCIDQTSPFQWPFSVFLQLFVGQIAGLFKSLLLRGRKTGTRNTTTSPNLFQPVAPTKPVTLVPSYNTRVTRAIEFDTDDLQILSKVISDSYALTDICRAMEQIRCIMLLPNFDMKSLRVPIKATHSDNSPSTLEFMLVSACANVVSSSVSYTGFAVLVNDSCVESARCAASFLEAYLQFDSEGPLPSECLTLIESSQTRELVVGLLQQGLDFTNGSPSDIVLAVSLRAKLSHRSLQDGDQCKRCLSEMTTIPILSAALKRLLENGEPNTNRMQFVHQLIYVLFTTLTECLLSYCHPDHTQWQFINDHYISPLKVLMDQLAQLTPLELLLTQPMIKLCAFARQKKSLYPDDQRKTAWFNLIISYCDPSSVAVSAAGSSPTQPAAVIGGPTPLGQAIPSLWAGGVQASSIPDIRWDPHPYELA